MLLGSTTGVDAEIDGVDCLFVTGGDLDLWPDFCRIDAP